MFLEPVVFPGRGVLQIDFTGTGFSTEEQVEQLGNKETR
jgi:hypothetical protein